MAKKKNTATDKVPYIWAALRILIGLVFLWAFMDKMFGLGFATCRVVDTQTKEETVQVLCAKSVAKGGSATTGFLKFAAKGPVKDVYNDLAGNKFVDFVFMAGLGLIGLCLVLGIGVKVASISGILMLLLMWLALIPGENNPFIDDHIIYAVALLGVFMTNKNQVWGLGSWWQKQAIVKKHPILA
jgi:thiosulfate dehydrogenase [quinone] large subunit